MPKYQLEEQKILEQFNVLEREPMQDPVIEIPENQVDYVLKLLEQENIRLP
jgi:predicted transcriptional regulator